VEDWELGSYEEFINMETDTKSMNISRYHKKLYIDFLSDFKVKSISRSI